MSERSVLAPITPLPVPAPANPTGEAAAQAPRSAEGTPSKPRVEVLTVAELTTRIHARIQTLGSVIVEGEVTGFRGPNPSGHLYFQLQDERYEASLTCVMFRREAQSGGGEKIQNGARIRMRAEPNVYPARGALQLVVAKVRLQGEGDLAMRREALRRKLEAEGLLDPARKRPLPSDPRVVGVVTSATGAAFADIVKVARRRGAVRILLSPAQVQGEAAPAQLIRALQRIEQVAEVDVVIIGRGGGSPEDLAAFDDEGLARAIASCSKVVVAAVGHEVDWSIACMVADVRAATPSHAAELVVPDRRARQQQLEQVRRRLEVTMAARLERQASSLLRIRGRLRAPERALNQRRQQVDELLGRALAVVRARTSTGTREREVLVRRLAAQHPQLVIQRQREVQRTLELRLHTIADRTVERLRAQLSRLGHALQAVSPLSVLGRGYAIALGPDGRALVDARQTQTGDRVTVRLHRGRLTTEVVATDDEV